jgi:hypothetical protein
MDEKNNKINNIEEEINEKYPSLKVKLEDEASLISQETEEKIGNIQFLSLLNC